MDIIDLANHHWPSASYSTQVVINGFCYQIGASSADQVRCIQDYFSPYAADDKKTTSPFPYKSILVVSDLDAYLHAKNIVSHFEISGIVKHHPDTEYFCYEVVECKIYSTRSGYDHMIFDHLDGRYTIFLSSQDDPESPKPALRLLRELVVSRLEAANGITVHGSAATCGKRGFIFVGSSGSGKTTCAAALAMRNEGRFLSGDRSVISLGNGSPRLYGWPMAINIGHGALSILLRSANIDLPSDFRNSYFETCLRNEDGKFDLGDKNKFAFTPVEFKNLLNINFCSMCELDAIFFPNLVPSDQPFAHMTRLSPTDIVSRVMKEARIGPKSGHGYGLVSRDYDVCRHAENFTAALLNVFSSIPGYDLRISFKQMEFFLCGDLDFADFLNREVAVD